MDVSDIQKDELIHGFLRNVKCMLPDDIVNTIQKFYVNETLHIQHWEKYEKKVTHIKIAWMCL